MRRVLALLPVVGIALLLLLVLQWRKQVFIAKQVELLQSDDDQEATTARKRLQRVGRSAVRPVCALLEHEDEEVRARAALTLANIGHAAACGPLMEAAKRGEFPAADALAFMKHPRAKDARASAYWAIGDRVIEELTLGSPVGGRAPTEAWSTWAEPPRDFCPARTEHVLFPDSLGMRWQGSMLLASGLTGEAYLWYAKAQKLSPAVAATATRQAAKDDHARLVRKAREILGPGVRSVVGHPTWREGDREWCASVLCFEPGGAPGKVAAEKLVVFACEGGGPESARILPTFTAPIFRADEVPVLMRPEAYIGLVCLNRDERAAVVLIRTVVLTDPSSPVSEVPFDVALYRLQAGKLVRTHRFASAEMPWVGDLDRDGDAEIVTWRAISDDPELYLWVPPWPIVRTLVDGRYEVQTERFRSLFVEVARALQKGKYRIGVGGPHGLPDDPRVPEHLGRAYELLGEKQKTIAAYQRAETKHLQRASREQTRGVADRARRHKELAIAVRQRRLRLEADLRMRPR